MTAGPRMAINFLGIQVSRRFREIRDLELGPAPGVDLGQRWLCTHSRFPFRCPDRCRASLWRDRGVPMDVPEFHAEIGITSPLTQPPSIAERGPAPLQPLLWNREARACV